MELMPYLPDYYANSPEMGELQRVLGGEVGALRNAVEDFAAQLSPLTATWGLSAWETAVAAGTNETVPLNVRRGAVLAKLRTPPITTAAVVLELAEAAFGGSCSVTVDAAASTVTIRSMETRGIPEGLSSLTATLRIIMPAHLRWVYGIRHYTWAEIMAMYPTWADISGRSFLELCAVNV
ncbi:MAG: DUF2313 domain-containing protein [Oscillospiraceae bacterium]|nr:DUF2313 domain-containing protein [Oscillospiraceae bacterium]